MFNYDKQPILYITLIYTVNYLSSPSETLLQTYVRCMLSIIAAVEFNEFMPWYGLIQSMLDRLVKISFFSKLSA